MADGLASIGLKLNVDYYKFPGLPRNVIQLLEDDRLGVPTPRTISL